MLDAIGLEYFPAAAPITPNRRTLMAQSIILDKAKLPWKTPVATEATHPHRANQASTYGSHAFVNWTLNQTVVQAHPALPRSHIGFLPEEVRMRNNWLTKAEVRNGDCGLYYARFSVVERRATAYRLQFGGGSDFGVSH
jgi:hypothetical protein